METFTMDSNMFSKNAIKIEILREILNFDYSNVDIDDAAAQVITIWMNEMIENLGRSMYKICRHEDSHVLTLKHLYATLEKDWKMSRYAVPPPPSFFVDDMHSSSNTLSSLSCINLRRIGADDNYSEESPLERIKAPSFMKYKHNKVLENLRLINALDKRKMHDILNADNSSAVLLDDFLSRENSKTNSRTNESSFLHIQRSDSMCLDSNLIDITSPLEETALITKHRQSAMKDESYWSFHSAGEDFSETKCSFKSRFRCSLEKTAKLGKRKRVADADELDIRAIESKNATSVNKTESEACILQYNASKEKKTDEYFTKEKNTSKGHAECRESNSIEENEMNEFLREFEQQISLVKRSKKEQTKVKRITPKLLDFSRKEN